MIHIKVNYYNLESNTLNSLRYSRVVSTYDLTNKYITYVCFTVKHRTNTLIHYQNDRYSEEQEKTHNLIKSLHDSVLGYRKIS